MTCITTATTAIPKFLLPQLTWKPHSLRPLALTVSKPSLYHSASCLAISASRYQQSRHDHSITKYLSRSPLFSVRQSLLPPSSPLRQSFSTAPRLLRDHHFDTLKFVQRLQDEGFSEDQARAVMLVLSDVIEESIQNLTRTMVLREGTAPPPPSPSSTPPCSTELNPRAFW